MSAQSKDFKEPDLLGSTQIRVDPEAPGTIVRYAFAFEAAANVFGGSMLLLFPAQILSMGVARPLVDVNGTSIQLARALASFVFAITPQLILGIPNTRTAIESRPMVYWTLLAGEAALIPLLLWLAVTYDGSGLTPNALAVAAANLVPFVLWRLWVLLAMPEMMGRYAEVQNKKEQ